MKPSSVASSVLLTIGLAAVAVGQQVPFQLVATQGNNAATIQNGGGLTFTAPVGQTQTAQVKATYTGAGQITISQQPITSDLRRSPQASSGNAATATKSRRQRYHDDSIPANQHSPQTTAQISLPYSEATPSAGGSTTTTLGTISLALQGTAPNFVLSYVLQTDQNVVSLPAEVDQSFSLPLRLIQLRKQP